MFKEFYKKIPINTNNDLKLVVALLLIFGFNTIFAADAHIFAAGDASMTVTEFISEAHLSPTMDGLLPRARSETNIFKHTKGLSVPSLPTTCDVQALWRFHDYF